MFNFSSYWFWIFLASILVVLIVGRYKTKNLPPKQKALRQLFYSFVAFGIVIWYLIFTLPFFWDFTSVPEKIHNLEEAQRILQDQNRSLEELRKNLSDFRSVVYLFLFIFVTSLLPSIYDFAKAITPNDEVKIPDSKVEEKKPILGLNDE